MMMNNEIFNDSFFAFENHCDVVFYGIETDFANQVFHQIKDEVLHFEQILNRNISDSQVAELNKSGSKVWLNISDDLWPVLTLCFDYYQISNGAFDITIAPLISFWKEKNMERKISDKELINVLKLSGFDKVEFDFENQRIQIKTDGVEFDFGAIQKGIALDAVKIVIEKSGIENGVVTLGENSILALGKHMSGKNWPIGIRNVFQPNELIHVFSASNETISTSGTVYLDNKEKPKENNQIISPATGFPVEGLKTVSVKLDSATLGEFLSKIWLILSENDREILAEQFKALEILEVNYKNSAEVETKLTLL